MKLLVTKTIFIYDVVMTCLVNVGFFLILVLVYVVSIIVIIILCVCVCVLRRCDGRDKTRRVKKTIPTLLSIHIFITR